jgi:hypothetical protein
MGLYLQNPYMQFVDRRESEAKKEQNRDQEISSNPPEESPLRPLFDPCLLNHPFV